MPRLEHDSEQKLASSVDMERYLGQWYEIARIPNMFQPESHVGGMDTYLRQPDGSLKVIYSWHEQRLDAGLKQMEGRMWAVDASNTRLKVQFFWPIEADYWVLERAADYSYTVVGYPDRSMAWIMSRKPGMDEKVYQGIVSRLKAQNYPVEKLLRVTQPR